VATDILPMFEAEAKERQREAGGWRGNQYEEVAVVALLPQPPNSEPEPKAAAP